MMKIGEQHSRIQFIVQNYDIFEHASVSQFVKVKKKMRDRYKDDVPYIVTPEDMDWFGTIKKVIDLYKGTYKYEIFYSRYIKRNCVKWICSNKNIDDGTYRNWMSGLINDVYMLAAAEGKISPEEILNAIAAQISNEGYVNNNVRLAATVR